MIIVSRSRARIMSVTQSGIMPFTVSIIAVRLTSSLSAKKSIMERNNEGYFLDRKLSKKPTKEVRRKINNAMPLLFNKMESATTNERISLSHVIVENTFSLLILSFISLFLAYVYKRRWDV